jgi:hypothetical protein
MKNLLITVGDSYTEGVGCYDPSALELYLTEQISSSKLYENSTERFKKFAWPTYVAKNINYDLINIGQGGYSNSAIAKSLIKENFKNLKNKYDNVIVISLFSCPSRISFYRDGGIYSLFSKSSGDDEEKLYNSYVNFIKSSTDSILETAFYIRCIESFCKSNGYHLFYGTSFTSIHEIAPYYNTKYNLHNYFAPDISRISDFIKDSPEMKSVCNHPNEKGHAHIGNIITNVLINNFSDII